MPDLNLTLRLLRRWLAGAALAAALLAPVAAGAQVVVVANGSPITEFDIQQRTKLMASATHKAPSRQDVINELIDDRLKIAKAKVYGMEISAEQIDQAFEGMAKRQGLTAAQFTQVLERAGIAASALKARMKAELTWSELVRGRYASTLKVGDADVANVLRDRNEADKDTTGYVYTLYPVTVVVPSGSAPAVVEAKRQVAESLRARFANCKEGLAIARSLRDVAVREPITRASGDLPPQTRELLGSLEVGHLTTPDATAQGLQMFALCDKKQTNGESPIKRQVHDEIFAKRFEAESKRFMEELRKSAMIEYK
jgi:peptidyl-prolyl cis-trans isomerase SurA